MRGKREAAEYSAPQSTWRNGTDEIVIDCSMTYRTDAGVYCVELYHLGSPLPDAWFHLWWCLERRHGVWAQKPEFTNQIQ